mgnify:CR=1 FL=1
MGGDGWSSVRGDGLLEDGDWWSWVGGDACGENVVGDGCMDGCMHR